MLTKIQKWGNSQAVRIPKKVLHELGIKPEDSFEMTIKDNVIHLKKTMPEVKGLDQLFAEYKGDYRGEEIDTGKPLGKEVW